MIIQIKLHVFITCDTQLCSQGLCLLIKPVSLSLKISFINERNFKDGKKIAFLKL